MLNTRTSTFRTAIEQKEQTTLFQTILEISDDAIFIVSKTDSTIVDCNTAALKLFEADSKMQLKNIPSTRLYNSELFDYSIEKINEELNVSGEYTQELAFRTLKQNIFWGKLYQKNLGFAHVNFSVLKIKKSANYLKDEEWLSEIFRISSKSTGRQFFKDIAQYLCRTFNAKYAFIARRSATQLNNLKLFYFHGGEIKIKHIAINNSFVEHTMRGYTSFYPQGLSELFPSDKIVQETGANSFIGAPFFDANNEPLGLIGVLSEDSMEEIPNSRYMLNILGSRTASEIQRIRSKEILRQQTRKLAEINQMKDKLLSVISDDLQAPLSTIIGYSSMLNDKLADYSRQEIGEKMQVMDVSLKNLYMLLENLSDWSKLQQEKVRANLKSNNLCNILDDVKPYISYLSSHKDIAVLHRVPSVLNVQADGYLIRSAIRNIAAYTLKNTAKGGSLVFDAQLREGKWIFIIKTDRHLVDAEELHFVVNSSKQEFYISSKEISIPALGLFIAREFIRLQNALFSVEVSEKTLQFNLEFEKAK